MAHEGARQLLVCFMRPPHFLTRISIWPISCTKRQTNYKEREGMEQMVNGLSRRDWATPVKHLSGYWSWPRTINEPPPAAFGRAQSSNSTRTFVDSPLSMYSNFQECYVDARTCTRSSLNVTKCT
jgi:hypothetical protein